MKKWMLGLFGAAAMTATASAQVACVVADDGSGTVCQTLYAGQTIDAGSVCVTVDGDNLTVTYETTGGWELVETHLWVGDNIADMPQTRKGNPKIGNFPYHSGDITGDTSYTVTIPLADLGFSCPGDDVTYFVAAHASLRKLNDDGSYQTETGWGDGDPFVTRGSWATFSSFVLHCCDDTPPPPETECETAFAMGTDSFCFLDIYEAIDWWNAQTYLDESMLAMDFNRWGWTNLLFDGTQTMPIYAGAGQCDTSKGTLVGSLTTTFDSSTGLLEVTYSMLAGFELEETHVYAGNEGLPLDNNGEYTVAPGQYTEVTDLNGESTYTTVIDLGAGYAYDHVFIVAHAVVCSSDWPE